MRIIIVQYAGDYREAVYRFTAGQGETYYAQKYSVETVAAIAPQVEEIAVLCCTTEAPYNELLPNGVRAIGAGQSQVDFKAITQLIAAYQPTHLSLNMPVTEILNWANQGKISTLAFLADSFNQTGLRARMRHYRLAQALNHPNVKWVGNHGVVSAQSLQAIGVKANKIIPWDWPHSVTPDQFPTKSLTATAPKTLVYVGALVEAKGIGDLLAAVASLKAKQIPLKLKVAGKGELAALQQQAQALNIADAVEFLGLMDNKAIVPLMQAADLVIVPSRHDYPEGFPMTLYEALSARTPIVASDHPMFVRQLQHRVNAMLFPASNSAALAQQIETVLTDTALYHQLSEASQPTWQRLQIPVKMADLLNRWIFDSAENRSWLSQHSLASGRYDRSITAALTPP